MRGGDIDGRTHDQGCHAEHLDCAQVRIAELEAELLKEIDKKSEYAANWQDAARERDEALVILQELEFSRYCRGAATGACHFCRAGTSDDLDNYPKVHEQGCKMATVLGGEAGDGK